METDKWLALARKHKVALAIGAVVLALFATADGGQQAPSDPSGYEPAIPASDNPGFDKPKYDDDQRRDDDAQRNRIDTIREVERCLGDDGKVYEAPLGTCT